MKKNGIKKKRTIKNKRKNCRKKRMEIGTSNIQKVPLSKPS
jgi:hypothetical protein